MASQAGFIDATCSADFSTNTIDELHERVSAPYGLPGHDPHAPRRGPGGIGDLAVVGDAGALLPALDSLLTAREVLQPVAVKERGTEPGHPPTRART
jgi:hypothetical protein